jgi:hypothetical protein
MRHTTGANFMRRSLNISGLNSVSVDPGPLIRRKPITTIAMLMASKMKLIRLKAKFLLSIYIFFVYMLFVEVDLKQDYIL